MLVNLFSSESSSKPNFVLKLISQDNQNSLKGFFKVFRKDVFYSTLKMYWNRNSTRLDGIVYFYVGGWL